MKTSLKDIQEMNGFKDVNVEYFRQLPFIWNKKYLLFLAEISRIINSKFFI